MAPFSRTWVFCQMLLENSSANGAVSRIIGIGRVRIDSSPLLAETGDEGVPYPFRSKMAKGDLYEVE